MPVPPNDQATAERQTLDEIRDWHRGIVEAIVHYIAFVQRSIRDGSPIATRFVGMTEGDLDKHLDDLKRDLDRLTVLNLVASAEATITQDYLRRVNHNLKDPLARAYQAWHKTLSTRKKRRPDFDEPGILTKLKEAKVVDNHLVGQYRECLPARHWVAHGRHWPKPTEVDRLDVDDVYDRVDALLRAMPN